MLCFHSSRVLHPAVEQRWRTEEAPDYRGGRRKSCWCDRVILVKVNQQNKQRVARLPPKIPVKQDHTTPRPSTPLNSLSHQIRHDSGWEGRVCRSWARGNHPCWLPRVRCYPPTVPLACQNMAYFFHASISSVSIGVSVGSVQYVAGVSGTYLWLNSDNLLHYFVKSAFPQIRKII